jgi:hypothetical protein
MSEQDQARMAECEIELSQVSYVAQVNLSPEEIALVEASCRLDEALAEARRKAIAKLAAETDRLMIGDSTEQEGVFDA